MAAWQTPICVDDYFPELCLSNVLWFGCGSNMRAIHDWTMSSQPSGGLQPQPVLGCRISHHSMKNVIANLFSSPSGRSTASASQRSFGFFVVVSRGAK
jgi:hypothetical protein